MTCALLSAHKLHDDVPNIVKATEYSACFDVSAFLLEESSVKYYDSENCVNHVTVIDNSITILPGWRVLIPTGYVFDVPLGFSLRAHPRSGNSLKSGISLCNCEGIIDADYVEQTFAVVINFSNVPFKISTGDRIIQIELVEEITTKIMYVGIRPEKKSTRTDGFGHSGTSTMPTTNVYDDVNAESVSVNHLATSKRAIPSVPAGSTSSSSLCDLGF